MSHWEQHKWVAATFVSLLCIGLMTKLSGQEPLEQSPGPGPLVSELLGSPPLDVKKGDDQLRELLIRRYNVALEELKQSHTAFETGGVNSRAVVDAGIRLLEAELSLAEDAAGRIAVLQKTVNIVREFESAYQSSVDSGERSQLELQRVRYERLTMEIELLKAKQEL